MPVLATIGNALVSALLAPDCIACGAILETPLSGCVCRNCWAAVDRAGDTVSVVSPLVERSRALGRYDGPLREIIHALKYDGRRTLAAPLAVRMRAAAELMLAEADAVVPIPLHWYREYSRGFNQAAELARHLDMPVVDALTRIRATASQIDLDKAKRHANVAHAFALRRRWNGGPLRGMNLVLIDDVATTGATLDACARVLKRAGAARIDALTAARA